MYMSYVAEGCSPSCTKYLARTACIIYSAQHYYCYFLSDYVFVPKHRGGTAEKESLPDTQPISWPAHSRITRSSVVLLLCTTPQ